MPQTKIDSVIEVCSNVGSGFIFALLVWTFVIPVMYPRMSGPVDESVVITTTFTVVSILRGYFWRRLFANGVRVTVLRWIHFLSGGRFGKIGGTDG